MSSSNNPPLFQSHIVDINGLKAWAHTLEASWLGRPNKLQNRQAYRVWAEGFYREISGIIQATHRLITQPTLLPPFLVTILSKNVNATEQQRGFNFEALDPHSAPAMVGTMLVLTLLCPLKPLLHLTPCCLLRWPAQQPDMLHLSRLSKHPPQS